jgi:hypothetical protein
MGDKQLDFIYALAKKIYPYPEEIRIMVNEFNSLTNQLQEFTFYEMESIDDVLSYSGPLRLLRLIDIPFRPTDSYFSWDYGIKSHSDNEVKTAFSVGTIIFILKEILEDIQYDDDFVGDEIEGLLDFLTVSELLHNEATDLYTQIYKEDILSSDWIDDDDIILASTENSGTNQINSQRVKITAIEQNLDKLSSLEAVPLEIINLMKTIKSYQDYMMLLGGLAEVGDYYPYYELLTREDVYDLFDNGFFHNEASRKVLKKYQNPDDLFYIQENIYNSGPDFINYYEEDATGDAFAMRKLPYILNELSTHIMGSPEARIFDFIEHLLMLWDHAPRAEHSPFINKVINVLYEIVHTIDEEDILSSDWIDNDDND